MKDRPQDTVLYRPRLLVSKEMAWTELWMHLSILTKSRTVIFESFVAIFHSCGLCSSRLMYVCWYLGKGTSLKGMATRVSMDTKEVRSHAVGNTTCRELVCLLKCVCFYDKGAGIARRFNFRHQQIILSFLQTGSGPILALMQRVPGICPHGKVAETGNWPLMPN